MSALLPGQAAGESVSDYALRVVSAADVQQRTMLAIVMVLESEPMWRSPERFGLLGSVSVADYARWLRMCNVLRDCAERLSVVTAEYLVTDGAK